MTGVQNVENPPTAKIGGLNSEAFPAKEFAQTVPQKSDPTQVKIDPSTINCRSMRADELRRATEIDLDQIQVKILTAKHFNREGLDDDADEILREVWRALRVTITPMRNGLRLLREGSK
jgi:hypothetical protein